MEPYITCIVTDELERLQQYLATQPAELHVSIDSPVPVDRYLIPNSFVLIVQYAQRYNLYPLHISICFQKYTVEVSYPVHPRQVPDENFPDLDTLVALYRNYFSLPEVHQTSEKYSISIPLFI